MPDKHIPYRITIELAFGERGQTVTLTGETPDLRGAAGATRDKDAMICAITANALLWQSNAMAEAAGNYAQFDKLRRALNVPMPVWRM